MYYVLKNLYDAKFLKIYENKGTIVEIPTKGMKTHFMGDDIIIKETPFNEEWNHCYNNLVLTHEKVDKPIIILQDYGDDEDWGLEKHLEVPKELILGHSEPSIGFYDGKIVYFQETSNEIVGVVIGTMDEEINVKELRQKRPYNFGLFVEENYTLDSPIECCLWIQYNEKKTEKKIWKLNEAKYGNFVHPYVISEMIQILSFPKENLRSKDSDKYITRNYLINKGFSFDANDKSWYKGDKKIWEDDICGDEMNLYFYKSPKRYTDDIIYRKDELEEFLK